MKLGEIIKSYRNDNKITMQDIADKSGLSKGYISMLENGKNPRSGKPISPNIESLSKLAAGMNTDLETLIQILGDDQKVSLEEVKTNPTDNAHNTGWDADQKLTFLPQNCIRQIPVYESASAGFGVVANPIVIEYMPIYIKCQDEADNTLCITVSGDSMYPKIEDGDVVQVRKQTSVDSGSIAVVLLDGDDAMVKRVVYDENHIELQSINPEYAPKVFKGSDVQRVQVVGLVRKIIKSV